MLIIDRNEAERIHKLRQLQNHSLEVESSELSSIKWIWWDTISRLVSRWIRTKEDLLKSQLVEINSIVNNPISYRFIERFFKENNK